MGRKRAQRFLRLFSSAVALSPLLQCKLKTTKNVARFTSLVNYPLWRQ